MFGDSARREAEAADQRATSGQLRGPLDGRIIPVKALYDVAGTVTTAGSAILRELPPAIRDAVIVQRLRAAGAVIVGKTQMTEYAFSALGTNPHDGVPGNPRYRKRAPGGSSSGAVVSVVDGMAEKRSAVIPAVRSEYRRRYQERSVSRRRAVGCQQQGRSRCRPVSIRLARSR